MAKPSKNTVEVIPRDWGFTFEIAIQEKHLEIYITSKRVYKTEESARKCGQRFLRERKKLINYAN